MKKRKQDLDRRHCEFEARLDRRRQPRSEEPILPADFRYEVFGRVGSVGLRQELVIATGLPAVAESNCECRKRRDRSGRRAQDQRFLGFGRANQHRTEGMSPPHERVRCRDDSRISLTATSIGPPATTWKSFSLPTAPKFRPTYGLGSFRQPPGSRCTARCENPKGVE